MPKRTRSRSLVRQNKKRRSMRRVFRKGIKRSMLGRSVHHFSRWCTNSNTEGQGSWTSFLDASLGASTIFKSIVPLTTFNALASYTELTNLYDQYKITRVVYKIQMINNPDAGNITNSTTAGNNSTNWYPKLWYIRDYDDSSAISNLDELRQYVSAKCIVLQPNKVYTISSRPAVLNQTYATAITTGYTPKWNQWIDCGQPDVPYYGIKFGLDTLGLTPSTAAQLRVRFDTKFYFSMKTPR